MSGIREWQSLADVPEGVGVVDWAGEYHSPKEVQLAKDGWYRESVNVHRHAYKFRYWDEMGPITEAHIRLGPSD
ncbi:hypothetical protein [Segniliparus rugosus]|uniref:Uncharacterized protein n=1 Tax=Segniliparus rugosus (strain ATCC BAA-974 / DSM 45345 / CCUG 50838 / CIP 108380 / JCM 13579 / CDC 945) TaxID=679197 RepID=E5XRW8_SEGRC|nr:hypothetical protein [Segniliparus rugosus]EFV12903.1 hypothetical protein HMPREF9336_02240 [Segniliparus rugosus ATCC BAA-974]